MSAADAADVAQTVWQLLFVDLPKLRDPERLGGWIATTARRQSFAVIGRLRRQRDVVAGCASLREFPDAAPDEGIIANERRQAVRCALSHLSPAKARLLELVADRDVPYDEVSERLGIPVGSIGPTRQRALQQLSSRPEIAALR